MSKRKGWQHGRPKPPPAPKPSRPERVLEPDARQRMELALKRYEGEKHFLGIAELLSMGLGYRVEDYMVTVRARNQEPVHIRINWRRDGNNSLG